MNISKPNKLAPSLEVKITDGETWDLSKQSPENFTMIVFYRGLHCPICKGYLKDLNSKVDEFQKRGVQIIAISGDSESRAKKSKEEWKLDGIFIGYNQSIDSMRQWGLFVSKKIKDEEPDLFAEPGLFLIKPDQTIYYVAINSMPFGRPHFQDILDAIDFVIAHDYPARGEA